jgi:stage V sporulation protein B
VEHEGASTASTRRGAIAIGGAKAWFLVAGLAQNILLPWAIGQGGYGAYKRALAFVNLLNNVIVAASIQSVSRAVAAAPGHARRETMRRAVLIQVLLGLGLGAVLFLSVPAIIAHQHAPHLATPLRVLSGVLITYGLYASLVGALNGVRAFAVQASLDATYSTLRFVLTVSVAWWFVHRMSGDAATGAALGFLASALTIVPLAWLLSRRVRDDEASDGAPFATRAHLTFIMGLLAMQAFQALLLQVDLMVLGREATLRAIASGMSELDARAAADRLSGLYAQAQAFGLVPYQLLVAAGFVLFPTVAAAHARGDLEGMREGVSRGGTATLVVAGAIVAAIGGTPMAVLRFAFGRGDSLPLTMAAPILTTLAVAHGMTAIATLGTTLIAASGRGRLAAGLAGIVAALALLGVVLGARSEAIAMGVALGLAAGLAIAAGAIAWVVARVIGPYVRLVPGLRVIAATGVALWVGARVPLPSARVLAPLAALAPLAVYLLVITVLGESLRSVLLRTPVVNQRT